MHSGKTLIKGRNEKNVEKVTTMKGEETKNKEC